MTTTPNLHLPQWEASDRIHHDDFNGAFEKLDAGNAGAHVTTGGFVVTKKRITSGNYNYDHYTNEATVRFYYLAIG